MSDDQHSPRASDTSSVEEAAEAGPLPEDVEQSDSESSSREDLNESEGVIPNSDNDLDPERDLTPEERQRAIAEDETVGGIFQPGGRGG